MLLWSLGMWPSRDNVWTNSTVNATGLTNEAGPDVQTAMAVLAGGPYGPADVTHTSNRPLPVTYTQDTPSLIDPPLPVICGPCLTHCLWQQIAGAMNKSLIMKSCRADGVLLRADKPATAIDQSFAASFDDLKPRHVWGSYSQTGAARWTYLLALNLDAPLTVPMATLDENPLGWVAFEGWHGLDGTGPFTAIPGTASG